MCSFMSLKLLGSINSHSQTYKGSLKEDNKFRSPSCQIRNNMEIYSPCKWLSFLNKGNEEQGCFKETWMLPFLACRLSLGKRTKTFVRAEGPKLMLKVGILRFRIREGY